MPVLHFWEQRWYRESWKAMKWSELNRPVWWLGQPCKTPMCTPSTLRNPRLVYRLTERQFKGLYLRRFGSTAFTASHFLGVVYHGVGESKTEFFRFVFHTSAPPYALCSTEACFLTLLWNCLHITYRALPCKAKLNLHFLNFPLTFPVPYIIAWWWFRGFIYLFIYFKLNRKRFKLEMSCLLSHDSQASS